MKGIQFIVIFLSILLVGQLNAQEVTDNKAIGKSVCEDTETEQSPFYVSDAYQQGDKIYDNFRNIEDDKIADKYIPKGTIVHTPAEIFDLEASSDFRVPIEVLNVPSEDIEKTLKGSRAIKKEYLRKVEGLKNKKRVVKGDKGFIDKRSLKKVNEYVFILKENAPVYKSAAGTVLNDKKIRLKLTASGQFATRTCCLTFYSNENEKSCNEFYIYEILDSNNNVLDKELDFNLACNFLSDILPLPKEELEELSSTYSLLRDYAGVETDLAIYKRELEIIPETLTKPTDKPQAAFVKMPLTENNKGPFNSYHYGEDDKRDSDAFLTPMAQCTFLQVMKKFQEICKGPGCQVQFGNMHHLDTWGTHTSHDSGNCVDVRPFRKNDDSNAGLTYTAGRYDREKTAMFMDLVLKAGANGILFNDRKLREEYNVSGSKRMKDLFPPDGKKPEDVTLPRNFEGHNDHMHICFEKSNERVQDTCKSGVK